MHTTSLTTTGATPDAQGHAGEPTDAHGVAHQANRQPQGVGAAAWQARHGHAADLAAALQASRADTLATFAVLEAALPGLAVPLRPELNPPLWELGHIGWFQAFWIGRNPQCGLGVDADPAAPRGPAIPADAEALYDSSHVPHDSRWSLPLPDAAQTRVHLALQLQQTLALLADTGERLAAGQPQAAADRALYFHRLALAHEDMHHEAALYMAQGLGIAIDDPRWQAAALPPPAAPLAFEAGPWCLGSPADQGFAFDNELPAQSVAVGACQIDAQVVRWAEYLPFVDDDGYRQPRWWTEAGWHWLQGRQAAGADAAPRYLRRADGAWQQWRHGRWQALDLARAACHLSLHEAEAWCRWAGRRLPTEAEWERAACTRPDAFGWGQVWEWTASPFIGWPGFSPHPYRDYSAPWFDGRPVLRGASFMTQPRMRHPRYRNFFQAGRNDVPAGFRSCAA